MSFSKSVYLIVFGTKYRQPTIPIYVERKQKTHHKRVSFMEEYRQWLTEMGVSPDEPYFPKLDCFASSRRILVEMSRNPGVSLRSTSGYSYRCAFLCFAQLRLGGSTIRGRTDLHRFNF